MSTTPSHIKVSAADALEFEAKGPISPKKPGQKGWVVRVLFITGIIATLAAAWYVAGDKLISMLGGAESAIPVIYAKEGAIKVRPENPGGLKVPDRDKLVYGRLKGVQGEAQLERLLPGPEEPLPRPKGTASSESNGGNIALMPGISTRTPESLLTVPAEIAETELPVKLKPVNKVPTAKQVASAKRPGPSPTVPEIPKPAATNSGPTKLTPTKIAKSPVVSKPKPLSVQSIVPTSPVVVAEPKPKKIAAKIPASAKKVVAGGGKTYRVQLAAARTSQKAQAEWNRLRKKHSDVLGKLKLTVMKVDLGAKKGIYYRVRGGPFNSEAGARKVCKTLSSRKVACLLVKPGK